MTRPYIIALFLFGTAIIGSMVYAHFYLMEQAENATFLRAEEVLDQVIMDQYEELEISHMEVKELLADESKARFYPLLEIFTAAEMQIEKYQETLQQWESIDSAPAATLQISKISAYEALNNTVKVVKQIMLKEGKNFDLSEDDIQLKLRHYDKISEKLYPKEWRSSSVRNEQQIAAEMRLVTAELLSLMRDLLSDITAFGCSRSYEFDSYFPVVIDGFGDLKTGEARTIRFAIGSYSSELDPENVNFQVNGKRILLGKDGTAEYPFLTKKVGEHWLETSCVVTNPLTGETITGEGRMRINVR